MKWIPRQGSSEGEKKQRSEGLLTLTIEDDFDLSKIAGSGQCFRMTEQDGCYQVIAGSHVLRIREDRACGKGKALVLPRMDDEEARFWHRYFDLERDYASIRTALSEEDTWMRQAAESSKGIRILRQEPFEMLITFILSQRKSIPAIRACVEMLAREYGEEIEDGVFSFPAPVALSVASEEALRAAKLGYRAPYVLDAARRVADGRFDLDAIENLPDDELLAALMTVKGVGIKVASCVALFAYARFSLAPVDTWIAKIIDRFYGGENPFPRYGEDAGLLQQFAFYYAITHKEEFA